MNSDPAQIMETVVSFLYLMPIFIFAGFFLIAGIVNALIGWLKFTDSTYSQSIAIIMAGFLVSMALTAPIVRIGTEIPALMILVIFFSTVLSFCGFAAGTWIISRESVGKCFGLTALIGVAFVVLFILFIILVFIFLMIVGLTGP